MWSIVHCITWIEKSIPNRDRGRDRGVIVDQALGSQIQLVCFKKKSEGTSGETCDS